MRLEVKLLPVQKALYKSEKQIAGIYSARGVGKSYVLSFLIAIAVLKGERVLAVVHAPYYAVLPCIVVGAITKESEKEDWEMNDPKDYYSTYEDYVKDWDDWHWDFMEVQPLVKLKSPKWGYTMTDTITVPRIYLFPMATE